MTTENGGRRSASEGSLPPRTRRVHPGAILGGVIGGGVSAIAGHLIDFLLTDEPFAGWRVGFFLGGLIGAQIGGGNGLVGIVVMTAMVVCSAIGVAVPMVACWIWRPLPMDHWLLVLLTFFGGIAGALIGLTLGLVVLDPRRKWNKTAEQP